MTMDKDVGAIITGVLTDRPIGFSIDGEHKHYCIYPMTLGKLYVTSQLVESLGIDRARLHQDPFKEMLRVVTEHKEICCRLVAYYITREKSEILDTEYIEAFAKFIEAKFDDEDIVTVIVSVLRNTDVEKIIKGTGIDKESENMSRANAAKMDCNTLVFGGKSVWGAFIDVACERYGWTFDYVLWGISYANLTLLLKDKVTSIYLTDKERKKVHIRDYSGGTVSGDDRNAVLAMALESERHPN